ncbi:sigma-70 family RNA polymerase sigma factor [Nannocystis sp.]|uniref:RNA polymerase sigma factor n=1 Tax=Nannocystis sp. TaxID=1962667 RepID=UPI002422F039|nr:sigma-70 family RNA polymerase sigma factor [Nannocystis sp.]MBK7826193.1 sigma-70 family RNA polymerase sigma factor [Nannocystis sp.]MBK9758290.1 sigma-70 family RNA polymerase sigma factor [Nannocystis sp.]
MAPVRSDGELLLAWQGGDREAGNQLVDRYFDAITRFFRNKVCGDDDVAELVSQTFLGCTSGKDRFRGDASVRQYLYSIAQNVLRKYIRGRYKRHSELLDFATVCVQELAPASLSSIVAHKREAQSLVQALREIPVEDQVVLELMYFEGLSGSELAGVLGLPEGTVRGRLARGKQRLRERIAVLLASAPQRPTVTPELLDAWAVELRRQQGWQ